MQVRRLNDIISRPQYFATRDHPSFSLRRTLPLGHSILPRSISTNATSLGLAHFQPLEALEFDFSSCVLLQIRYLELCMLLNELTLTSQIDNRQQNIATLGFLTD